MGLAVSHTLDKERGLGGCGLPLSSTRNLQAGALSPLLYLGAIQFGAGQFNLQTVRIEHC